MRLTQKKIESILVRFVREEGLPLVRELIAKDNISEFDLATKLKIDIKVVRKRIYLLQDQNLVSFTKKKDKQKGWYIYYWTLIPESIKFNYYKIKREQLANLKSKLEEEVNELFFICSQNCVRLNFDESMDYEFHCPECGELINQEDSSNKIKIMKKNIVEIEKELDGLDKIKAKRKKIKEKKKEAIEVKKEKRKVTKKEVKKKKITSRKKIVKKTPTKKYTIKKTIITKKRTDKTKNNIIKKNLKRKETKQKKDTNKKKVTSKSEKSKKKIQIKNTSTKKTTVKKKVEKKKKSKKDEYF